MTSLCLVEDDDHIRRALEAALVRRGYEVNAASTGLAGLQIALDLHPDAVVLDLGLPDVDGLELIKMLRAVSPVPIVAATARDDEREIVRTLDAGADDYVVKPFSADHLDARVRAVLRRARRLPGVTVVVGDLVIDVSSRTVREGDRPVDLTRKEFDLLAYLAQELGRVVPRRELLAAVWDQPLGGADKTVDVHLSWLRRKLGETASAPRYLHVVRGVGVKMMDPRRP
jgi:DNA-binding response OmpR family regulator